MHSQRQIPGTTAAVAALWHVPTHPADGGAHGVPTALASALELSCAASCGVDNGDDAAITRLAVGRTILFVPAFVAAAAVAFGVDVGVGVGPKSKR
jgi:hypothetical protein